MKLPGKPVILLLSLLAWSMTCQADKTDNDAKNARNKTGKMIKCSPGGKVADTVTLEKGIASLKPGMVLRLLPGTYNSFEMPIIRKDRIIVEGDASGGYCNLHLVIYGRDCIVRNLSIYHLEAGDATIVDSKIYGLVILSSTRRCKSLIYNCAINSESVYPENNDVMFKYCTILRGKIVKNRRGEVAQTFSYRQHRYGMYSIINFGEVEKKGDVTFDKCIFYSNAHVFGRVSKQINLTLEDCLVYNPMSIINLGEKKSVNTLKNLNEYYNLRMRGSNSRKKPSFVKEPTNSWGNLTRDEFILKKDSPGKGLGVNMGPKGIPVPRSK